jgi:hypothetical protein
MARGCWKKYYWYYIAGLKPKRKTGALTLGKTIHDCFQKYYEGIEDAAIERLIVDIFNEEIANAPPDDTETLTLTKYTALGMWKNYPWKDRSEFEENFPEVEFCVRLGNMRGVRFLGRIDGLIKKDDKWWIREVKTSGLSPRQFQSRITLSSQATGYVYALRKQGYDIVGVMYEQLKKPLLRKRQTENAQQFGERILDMYAQDAKREPNDRLYYSRPFAWRTQPDLERWEADMMDLVRDVRARRRSGRWYRNTDCCWNYNSLCPYERICFQDEPDELTVDLFYDKRENNGIKEKSKASENEEADSQAQT